MKKRNVYIRIVAYCMIMTSVMVLVHMKQQQVRQAREKDVCSIMNEWEANGTPVAVLTVRRKDFYSFTKLTAERGAETFFMSYVPQECHEKLAVRQPVYYEANTNILCGRITDMSGDRDMNTGLFKVTMDLKESVVALNHREIVFVHTDTLRNVIQVPYSAVDLIDQQLVCRVVRDDRVVFCPVERGLIDREAMVITSGLEEGDLVITEGKSLVNEGDHVYMRREMKQ